MDFTVTICVSESDCSLAAANKISRYISVMEEEDDLWSSVPQSVLANQITAWVSQ